MNDVIKYTKQSEIAVICMEDRISKNTFTDQFLQSLKNVFIKIKQDNEIKAVVLHGYDNYFCCGGTQAELIKIHEGKSNFTDLQIHDILLACNVPVISAMQGHALGGGLVLGCYADIIVLSKQSMYSTNFMKYGFTPGFGSTFIMPHRFGDILGRELLFSAKNYSGVELQERGVGAKVVDKHQVINAAMSIAEELSNMPRLALLTLKEHFRSSIQEKLTHAIQRELEMHELTFKQPEVRHRIKALF
jgi:polyketide biosynthesis enoyl-CoA hydratase PksI